jgi:hypothetical protein
MVSRFALPARIVTRIKRKGPEIEFQIGPLSFQRAYDLTRIAIA